ncbi:YMGG-like glycine zipper-containing protein [Symmachiella dynata]|uniref:YMGG-like Gly-zipper domain-containing protein n=1 Tax=Symmachiella dynata TaxID=2527995 RepID=A0A517ZLQ6_9PLAN|nr:YMGG-like glycine zipper-containing protein [Symmachiella dynata]QDT47823.1 hypothetical protein Pan258_18610 [Symmachiella dynata]QDU43422.1 hypothetical protein Mal52_18960 [Symmachiella dynata]|tara:strand:+ start:1256 stop:1735 length:480 start_codon:yes stop_codon:yes gene_type:complete
MLRLNWLVGVVTICVMATGCQNMNNTEKGAVVGGASGAGIGAIVGKQLGSTGAGAAIGGVAGTLFGGAVGKAQDNAEEADMYREHAAQQEATRKFEQHAMNNYDIIKFAQAGNVSDEIIIGEIKRRGGRFDMSTEGILNLRENGVSEHVITTMQERARY